VSWQCFEHHVNMIFWDLNLCDFHVVVVGCLLDNILEKGGTGFFKDFVSVFGYPDEVVVEIEDVVRVSGELFHDRDSISALWALKLSLSGASSRDSRFAG
jgi:hypothetical protein